MPLRERFQPSESGGCGVLTKRPLTDGSADKRNNRKLVKRRMASKFTAVIAGIMVWLLGVFALAEASGPVVFGDITRAGNIIEIRPAATPEKSGGILLKTVNDLQGPAAEQPYLIRLSPGIYFLGNKALRLRPFVEIVGSGPSSTFIKGSVSGEGTGLIIGADNSSLKSLSISNTGKGLTVIGIYNKSSSPLLTNLNVTVAGSGECTYGLWNSSAAPRIENLMVTAEGAAFNHGIFNQESEPKMRRVTVKVSGGEEAFGVINSYSSPSVHELHTSAKNASSFNVALWNISSPHEMNRVSANASGGDQNIAVYNVSTEVFMDQTRAKALGDHGNNYAVKNVGASPVMFNSTATVSGGGYGIYNISSSPKLVNVLVSASGGKAAAIGIFNAGEGNRVKADRCTIGGSSAGVFSDSLSGFELGACALEGAVSGDGAFHCSFCYGAGGLALDSRCR